MRACRPPTRRERDRFPPPKKELPTMNKLCVAAALLTVGTVLAAPAWGADRIEFNRDIRPILAENCFACHGPDSAARKAKLRLDQPEVAIKAGAITPGKPQDSEMVSRIYADDPKERMPPQATNK